MHTDHRQHLTAALAILDRLEAETVELLRNAPTADIGIGARAEELLELQVASVTLSYSDWAGGILRSTSE